MRVLFVVPYPVDRAASQRYRVEQWLPHLQEQGVKYDVAPFWDQGSWAVLYKPDHIFLKIGGLLAGFVRRGLLLWKLPAYDFIFIHREASPVGPPWFEWMAAKVFREKIIFDFDDAIWLPNTTAENSWATRFKWHSKTSQICRWSHRVSCGNHFLRDYAFKFNTAATLLPSVLDTEQHYNARKEQHTQEVVIGWIGSHSTLPYLQLIEPVLQQLEQKYTFRLLVIADKAPQLQLRSLEFRTWRRETEEQDLLQINIGLMPLPDTEWAKGKCAFKALQYMALGIPAVVSAVGANEQAVVHGITGFTCTTEQDWYQCLERLLVNPGLRSSMGAEGQAQVNKHYSLQAHRQTFLNLFS